MPISGHICAWKRAAGLLCRFGTDRANSMLLLGNAVIEEGFHRWGLPFICRCMSAYICSLLQWYLSGVPPCSFCFAKRWNATLQLSSWCSVLSILVGNAGYAATAVSHCAYVFHRSVGIAEESWAYRWNFWAFGWWF
jgi:hypothetical protein